MESLAGPTRPAHLQFRGGTFGLFLPFAVVFVGILWLGLSGVAIPEAYWPMVIFALFVGLVLARDQQRYTEAVIAGVSSSMLAIMLMAWFLAGILGRLLSVTGVIEGLAWLALQVGLPASWFPLATFLVSGGLSLSTGTSIGTILAATPILFPAGFSLGADPLLLIGAIVGGAFVGDNLAPISDTTIVSAYSQGTEVSTVVRSRLVYALFAAGVTLLAYVVVGFADATGGTVASKALDVRPDGLIMLLIPAGLITMMVRGHHLVPALLHSLVAGTILGLVSGVLSPSDILSIDARQFTVGGFVATGINSMIGIGVFTIFLMGLAGTLEAGGLVDWMMLRAETFATTPRRAEMSIVGTTLLLNALTGAGTPSMIILGPFVRRIGNHFRLAPWRRANLMDACSTTLIGFLPYSVAVLIPFALVGDSLAAAGMTGLTPVHLIPFVFYCWALLIVIIVAAITGWRREFISPHEAERERASMSAASRPEPTLTHRANEGS